MGADAPAGLREPDRRGEQVGPGQPPHQGMPLPQRGQDAGHGDSLVAAFIDEAIEDEAEAIAGFATDAVGPHVRGADGGAAALAVQQQVPSAARVIGMQHAEAANAAHQRVHDTLGEGAGECRVDGVAAGAQRLDPGLDRLGLGGHDHGAGCG